MRPSTTSLARPVAVVIGLDCITGLQTARILDRHGIPVIALASKPEHFCCRTRVPQQIIRADTASVELIEILESLGPRLAQRAVLFPCTDASVLLLARHRERVHPWFHLALPATDTVEMLQDKLRFSEFAERIGLPVPRTRLLRERRDAETAAAALTFPCILKPALKTALWQQHTSAKVFHVDRATDLLPLYDRCSPWSSELMIQEWVEGADSELYSCNCYYNRDGSVVATFVARKLRQWPPHVGTSSLGEECRNDTVLDLTLKTFNAAGYRGLGYLEVKRDARSGEHFVIEANVGRPTGRSAIAEAGGVELVYAQYCETAGLPLPQSLEQRYGGAKWIFWRQDLRSAWYYWRRGELSLREWSQSIRGRKACAVFSWADPAPFLVDLWSAAVGLMRHIGRALRSAASGNHVAPQQGASIAQAGSERAVLSGSGRS